MNRHAKISALFALSLSFGAPAWAESEKELDCKYQASVAAAVQKARLDGVSQKNLSDTIAERKPDWPAQYNNAIPIFALHIYGLKKRQLRNTDLGAEWLNTCLTN